MLDLVACLKVLRRRILTGTITTETAIATIDELLKEMEPKMVVETTSTIRCPGCGKQITNRGATHREIHYCWKCGQAVKWK